MATALSTPLVATRSSKAWHVALWIVQIPLGVTFTMAGAMKLSQPIDALAQMLVWPGDLPPAFVRFLGACNLLGGLGLILPAMTRIRPWLTPLAGLGLATLMTCALVFHTVRGETFAYPVNLGFGLCAAFVAWGRYMKAPIAPRARG